MHRIQWSAFESNIARDFGDLKEDKSLADVTLVCGNRQVAANKVVLSVSSPFFRRIIQDNPRSHPLICLVGIKYSDLEALLSFAYFGEVDVASSELDTFLATAQKLEIKGLVPEENYFSNTQQQPPAKLGQSSVTGKFRQNSSKIAPENDCEEQEEPLVGQHLEVAPVPIKLEEVDNLHAATNENFEEKEVTTSTLVDHFGNYTMKISGGRNMGKFKCTICGKLMCGERIHAARHVEAQHFPGTFEYECDKCDQIFDTKSKWESHRSQKHTGAKRG